MLNGYDFDGVITAGIIPVEPFIVISGRKPNSFGIVVNGIKCGGAVYLRPTNWGTDGCVISAAHWKATMINLHGVTTFYEDEKTQLDIITQRCPSCKVIHVVNGVPQQ